MLTNKPQQNDYQSHETGFFRFIVGFIILALVIAYFNIDVRGIIDNNPGVANFFEGVIAFFVSIWQMYIYPVVLWIWDKVDVVFLPLWEWLMNAIESAQN